MAAPYWQQSLNLKERLFNTPYYFEFHQAIRILEQLYPNASHHGESAYTQNEITFLSSRTAYSYSPSDIDTLEHCSRTLQPLRMQVNFFGLAGANGPLPMPFTEQIISHNQNDDFALQDFIDIFNHRLLSIFHRIRKKYWTGLANCSPEHSPVARILYSFCGLGLESLKDRLPIQDRSLLTYTSVFWQQPASPSGLEMIIGKHFNIPVTTSPWQGKWIKIDTDQQTSLGQSYYQLGHTAALGNRFWDQMRTIQLKLGPLDWQQFNAFLPKGQFDDSLRHLTQFYLGMDYDVRYQLILRGAEIPKLFLGQNARLGWTTWLGAQILPYDINIIV